MDQEVVKVYQHPLPYPCSCVYCDLRQPKTDLERIDAEFPHYYRCADHDACDTRMKGKKLTPLGEVQGTVDLGTVARWFSLGRLRVR